MLFSQDYAHLKQVVIKAFMFMNQPQGTVRDCHRHIFGQNNTMDNGFLEYRNPKMRHSSSGWIAFLEAFDDRLTSPNALVDLWWIFHRKCDILDGLYFAS